MNYYSFHIGDYISHTSHLSDAEDLAYRRMIDYYYQSEQPFNDSSTLARRIRTNVETVDIILKEFFVLEDDGCWHNKRVDEEITKYHEKQNQASRAGKASAEARFNIRSTSVQPTKNQEPRTKNHIKATGVPPDGVANDIFQDYLKIRKAKKSPWTPTAQKLMRNEAQKANISLQDAMELCCARGWVGFKAEWVKGDTQTTKSDKVDIFAPVRSK
jgi:uncharacterized protein YdaU (DUF1376 family)